MSETDKSTFTIKRGLLDNLKRELIITPDFIQFQDKEAYDKPYTRFDKEQIVACRCGIRWLDGLKFTIGREYQIFIKDNKDKVLKINFSTFYGINKSRLQETYVQIVGKLWEYYFLPMAQNYLDKYNKGISFELCNVKIEKDAVTIKSTAGFFTKEVSIPWNDLGSSDYSTYFALYSKKEPASINCSFNYHEQWNVMVLFSVIRTIEKNRVAKV